MKTKKLMGMPVYCVFGIIGVLLLGIIIGSFCDFEISTALANKTDLGTFFATYGSYFSYCLYPIAGMCIYKGLKKKDKKFLGIVLFAVSYFMAVYYSNSYNGSKVRALFDYVAGESSPWICVLSWLFWIILYIWIPFVFNRIIDDSNADKIIAVGACILIAGILADNVNLWLKQVGSRPRFKYLITLEDPKSEFRNWWEFIPNLAGSNDNFKSWPSGNMSIAAMMFSLPAVTDVMKKSSVRINTIAFIFACVFVCLYGYNRIHMTNHFLSDVCFGTLFCYLIHSLVFYAFQKSGYIK